jgi:hypothetical protein
MEENMETRDPTEGEELIGSAFLALGFGALLVIIGGSAHLVNVRLSARYN